MEESTNPHQAPRSGNDDEGEYGPEDNPPIRDDGHNGIPEVDEYEAPDHGAEEIREASEEDHEDEVTRMRPIRQAGIDLPDNRGEKGSSRSGINGRYDE